MVSNRRPLLPKEREPEDTPKEFNWRQIEPRDVTIRWIHKRQRRELTFEEPEWRPKLGEGLVFQSTWIEEKNWMILTVCPPLGTLVTET